MKWAKIQARLAAMWRNSLRGESAVVLVQPVIGGRGPVEMRIPDAANAVRHGAAERVPGVAYPADFPRVARP